MSPAMSDSHGPSSGPATPGYPPPSLADPTRVARLAAELDELGRRLAWARYELLTMHAPAPGLPAPAPVSAPAPVPASAPAPVPAAGLAAPPVPAPGSPPATGTTAPMRASGTGGRLLAWTGGAITLTGVVLFLVLVANHGWLGVPARLVIGGLLGLALVGVGRWLRGRPGGQVGAAALVGTGVAALFLDLGAATVGYHYLPPVAGILGGLLVSGAGLALADRWRAGGLATFVVLGAGFFMPAVADRSLPLLVALALVPHAAVVPVAARRRWTPPLVLASAFSLVYGTVAAWDTAPLFNGFGGVGLGQHRSTTAAVVAVFLVGLGAAWLVARRLSVRAVGWLSAVAPMPALQLAGIHGRPGGVVLAGSVGAALLLAGCLPTRLLATPVVPRRVAAAAGTVAVFEATVLWFDGAVLTGVLLGQALVLAVAAAMSRRPGALLGAAGYGLVGLGLAVGGDAPIWALIDFPSLPYLVNDVADRHALVTGLAVSALALAAAVAFLVAAAGVGVGRSWLWAPVGLVGLYGAAGVLVTAGLLIAPVPLGFYSAHAVVTISWTVVALLLLARGVTRPPLRVAGLVLVAAAVAKLVLFDLVALDGLARVGAFVGAGLLLLGAGARYARVVAAAPAATDGDGRG